MKTATFNQVFMNIGYTRKPGFQYEIRATYKGEEVTAYTNDSEVFDFFNKYGDENTKRYWARKKAYNLIVESFNSTK